MSVNSTPSANIIVLAAGEGTRMRSSLPKVLHPVCGEAILIHVLKRISEAVPGAKVALVVGYKKEDVEAAVRAHPVFEKLEIEFVFQKERNGTGDAARVAMQSPFGAKVLKDGLPVLVMPGDFPLVSADLVRTTAAPLGSDDVHVLSGWLEDPTSYGRVLRDGDKVVGIVEHKDANEEQLKIKEVGTSIYAFEPKFLNESLGKLKTDNAQGEYYLPDLVSMAAKSGRGARATVWQDPWDVRGVNDLWELSLAEKEMNMRLLREWARKGVRVQDASNTYIDSTVELSEGVSLRAGATLRGKTQIGKNTIVGANVQLQDAVIGAGSELKTGTVVVESQVGDESKLGPYAHLRPGSEVRNQVKLGNFVELKKSLIDDSTSISHLSYVGDAKVGKRVNIGCGFVTCNFDGRVIEGKRKHETVIGDDVFIGSDCQTVAPVKLESGSYVASGSTVTENVEKDALAIARSRQVNKAGYAKKLRGE